TVLIATCVYEYAPIYTTWLPHPVITTFHCSIHPIPHLHSYPTRRSSDPDELSLAATMPRFLELERRERSVILGLWRASRKAPQTGTSGARWSLFVTFQNGMEEMVTTIASRLPPGSVLLKHRVDGIERRGRGWR